MCEHFDLLRVVVATYYDTFLHTDTFRGTP